MLYSRLLIPLIMKIHGKELTQTNIKNYYAEILIKYKDHTINEDEPNTEPYEGKEFFSLTCNGENEINAIENITKKALNQFNKNFSENIEIKGFCIDVFYETSDYARSS